MKNNYYLKIVVTIIFLALFVVSVTIPVTPAHDVRIFDKKLMIKDYDYYDCYHVSEISIYKQHHIYKEYNVYDDVDLKEVTEKESTTQRLNGPMNSPWPMYCHDTHHTGRSPYSTADNTGTEKWRFDTIYSCLGSPAIDKDDIIYVGGDRLYAIYPNGTMKWQFETRFRIASTPAIDENGVIYVGAYWAGPQYMYAIYKNNGTLKWKYYVGEWIASSPAIGNDGSIYFGSENDYIYALYPNGTLKWRYLTSVAVYSSPAIGDDGTVYCGSHDGNLYAFYPNNGTLKWFYHTGDWVGRGPSIADDGTVYFGSWDGYLYAVYPDGTLKWKTGGNLAGTTPVTAQDGTIYVGNRCLTAIYPTNGSIKWMFDPGPNIFITGGNPCISSDGTIYFGTRDSGEIIAVNSDGTLKWRKWLGGEINSAPAIGEDGTVYIGSGSGYLYAFGGIGPLEADANGPHYGLINQPVQFTGSATGGYRPYSWLWNFGDGQTSTLQNPTHAYINPGNYTVTLTVTDDSGNTSSDTTWAKIKESNNPPNKPSISGETNGETGTMYYYTFVSTDPDNDEYLNYYIDWGDGSNSGWKGPYAPGEDAGWGHAWDFRGTYIIKAKARDNYGGESDWGTLSVTMPLNLQINQQSSNQLLLKMIQRFTNHFNLLERLPNLQ